MRSWKTTLAGIAAMLGVVSKIVMAGTVDWGTDGPVVIGAIGLIAAKDHNVSGKP